MTRTAIRRHTDDDLLRRRAEIIRKLGGDEDSIRSRAAEYQLTIEEDALFDELATIDFLLWK